MSVGRFFLFLSHESSIENVCPLSYNVKVLCAVGDFENGTFKLPPKLNSSSNAQLTTSAPIAQNTCYKLAADY